MQSLLPPTLHLPATTPAHPAPCEKWSPEEAEIPTGAGGLERPDSVHRTLLGVSAGSGVTAHVGQALEGSRQGDRGTQGIPRALMPDGSPGDSMVIR